VVIAYCPYCALVLDPAPTVSRRCDRCRQKIMVKRVDGQAVYLTEAAVQVFDSERRRIANAGRLTRERERWLRLAATAGAPAGRQAQLAAARLSEEVVAASRSLYLTTVDRAVRTAKRDRDWDGASRIRRDQAMALYRLAGSPVPPPADVVATYREGVAAELRGVAEISRDAELVSARCCDACRADDGRIFRITSELRTLRLPHADCPKGLCRCHWDLAARDRRTIRRYLQRRPGTATRTTSAEVVTPASSEAAPTA
jgi:ketosteroid isomerase-like protein